MQGIYYAVFVAAILFIIRWYIQNETTSNADGTEGLLATRARSAKEPPSRLDISKRISREVKPMPTARTTKPEI